MGQNPAETQMRGIADPLRQFERFRRFRIDADAVISAIDLDMKADRNSGGARRIVEGAGHRKVIRDDSEAFTSARKIDRFSKLSGIDRHRIQNVGEAAGDKSARLGERRNGDRTRMPCRLQSPNFEAFVRLDVRAEPDVELGDARIDPFAVAAHAGVIEQQAWGF